MLTAAEAWERIRGAVATLPATTVPLLQSCGRVLRSAVTADLDSPPHAKSIVDGYAIMASDFAAGLRQWNVQEEVLAGALPRLPLTTGKTTRIMTGAPIPTAADAVVMFEETELVPSDEATEQVRLRRAQVSAGQNITPRGAHFRAGETILPAGTLIGPVEIALLAELGQGNVNVGAVPRVAILATGDELVPCEQTPGPGQIRNSNAPLLAALVQAAGGEPILLDTARDNRESLARQLEEGLAADVLLISGGISAGVADLVPSVLQSLRVNEVFHRVNIKPGKPLWFGLRDAPPQRTLVFGLPGNPVSGLVNFALFVRPILAALQGLPLAPALRTTASLRDPYLRRGGRETYVPAALESTATGQTLRLLNSKGSSDLRALLGGQGWAIFPTERERFEAGSVVEFLPLPSGAALNGSPSGH